MVIGVANDEQQRYGEGEEVFLRPCYLCACIFAL